VKNKACAWTALLVVLFYGSPAPASTMYNWQGTCTFGCSGTATGILTLVDSAGGPFNFNSIPDFTAPFNHSTQHQFISFQYTSSNGTYFMDSSPPGLFAEGYNSGGGNITFLESDEDGPQTTGSPLFQFGVFSGFVATGGSTWQLLVGRYGDVCLNADCSLNTYDVRDGGTISSFALASITPLPTTLPLFAIGLCALGLVGWRRKAKGTA
jgi:hypothetical protein